MSHPYLETIGNLIFDWSTIYICRTEDCRIPIFIKGEWKDGHWEYEESGAWSCMENDRCPACGEKGELLQ